MPAMPPMKLVIKPIRERSDSPHNAGRKLPMVDPTKTPSQIQLLRDIDILDHDGREHLALHAKFTLMLLICV